jgi:hypothetical protein
MTAAWLLCVALLLAVSCAAVETADVKQAKLAEIVAELDGNSDLSDAAVASLQRKLAELRHPTAHHTFQQNVAGGKVLTPVMDAPVFETVCHSTALHTTLTHHSNTTPP